MQYIIYPHLCVTADLPMGGACPEEDLAPSHVSDFYSENKVLTH